MSSATMKDIARLVGVSQPTVSHVLNGRAERFRISPQTQERVHEAAAKLGYRVNALARATRTGRSNFVALLLSTHSGRSYLPPTMLDTIHDALAERDLHLVLAKLPDAQLSDQTFVPRILRELGVDGLLIDYTDQIPPAMIELIERNALPAIWINTDRATDCVRPDDRQMGRLATEQLVQRGHRRIAYVDYAVGHDALAQAHYSRRERELGYTQAMLAAGLRPEVLRLATGLEKQQRADDLERLLREANRPTAVISYSPQSSALLKAMRRVGLSFPADLAWVSFADRPATFMQWDRESELHAGNVYLPHKEVAREAVAMLIDKLTRPLVGLKARVIPASRFSEGDLCLPPR
jgi:LacI family transcriptional regulator